jgi:uncharacterized RDD family membrane protein YckC
MKCPKCSYLGFDTGERCKNCGYDFSLMSVEEPAAELSLRIDSDEQRGHDRRAQFDGPLTAVAGRPEGRSLRSSVEAQQSVEGDLRVGLTAGGHAAAAIEFEPTLPPTSFRGAPALPLFGSSPTGEDEPLIKVPSQPRPPLAVRRTPETPRLKAVPPRPVERAAPEPALNFTEETAVSPETVKPEVRSRRSSSVPRNAEPSSAVRRLLAAVVDHTILLTIDATVLYLTLRMASLTMSEWTALPVLPMGTFLGLLKLSYFTAFTCVGGQTIGKMAAGIRVVSDDHGPIGAAHAVHRALAGAVSFMTLGAGFVPALFGSDRRALHDRLAHTRVVTLPTG